MTAALAKRINDLGAAAGPVPRGPGARGGHNEFLAPPEQTPAHLVERVLLGQPLSDPETVWFHRFVTLHLVSTLHAVIPAAAPQIPNASSTPASEAEGESAPSAPARPSTGEALLGLSVA